MKLKKILDTNTIQGFTIKNCSKRFKLLYPKKYIILLLNGPDNKAMLMNINDISLGMTCVPIVGYIFTHGKTIPNVFNNSEFISGIDNGKTSPAGLDQYFIAQDTSVDNINVIISCFGSNSEVPVRLNENIIMRCNAEQLVEKGVKDDYTGNIKKNILMILNEALKERMCDNTEEWLLSILKNGPCDINGFPLKYPKSINDKVIKENEKISAKDVSLLYDLRAKDYEFENRFISSLEEAFENDNEKICLYDTYNGLLDKIVKEHDRLGLKYKLIDLDAEDEDELEIEDMEVLGLITKKEAKKMKKKSCSNAKSIETTVKNVRKLNLDYMLTDFI